MAKYKQSFLKPTEFDPKGGMNAETVRHVFDRFYRAPTGNVHNIKGHGLGLAYVREVLSMHGAEIKVQSSLGKGSTFYFNLSIHHEES